jgi:signal transduction histidine kinase
MSQSRPNDEIAVEAVTAQQHEIEKLDEAIQETLAEQERSWEKLAKLSHKINNPLTSLIGRAQLLRQRDDADPYVRRAAEVIEESSKRIATYVRELTAVVKERREDSAQLVPRSTPRASEAGPSKP